MSMIGFPLLLIPLAVINIVVFLMGLPLDRLQEPVVTVGLPSLQSWTITFSDLLLAFSLLLLLLEVVKSARIGAKYVTDHLLSLVAFCAFAAEFLLLPKFAHSTFFLLTVMAFVDVVSGVWIRAVRPKAAVARTAPAIEDEPQPRKPVASEPAPAPAPQKPAAETVEPAPAAAQPSHDLPSHSLPAHDLPSHEVPRTSEQHDVSIAPHHDGPEQTRH